MTPTSATGGHVRLVLPNQLFEQHLRADAGTRFVLVEHDLLVRQLPFHSHKLVLHRASELAFADRLRGRGFEVELLESQADATTAERLGRLLRSRRPDEVSVFEPVDDWVEQDLRRVAADAGLELDELPTPAFCTGTADVHAQLGGRRPRMAKFYEWQRRRLDLLLKDGDQPVGGRWSFDEDNRRKLPKQVELPDLPAPGRDEHVDAAIAWVQAEFPDAPGDPSTFAWPTTRRQAQAWLRRFVRERLAQFGPYEDAVTTRGPWLFHSAVSPVLNLGLLGPLEVVGAAVEHADEVAGTAQEVPLSSLEGFVRQVVGWREYMRGVYVVHGRGMRTRNLLGLDRRLGEGWWDGTTGLDPVDLVVGRVLERGWCHHIERLMVVGNAMLLLRVDPDEVYRWFSALFVDAYDWVMVPNVYAMSQFAAGELVTTKPYVSGSNYLRKMSDVPAGDWCDDWDALFWTFVRDHLDGFRSNPRSSMMARSYEGFDGARKRALTRRAAPWLEGGVTG